MATYAIGDIQGCFNSLKELLKKINFKANSDKLWLTGDLVNRGPDSLKTLDFLLNQIPENNLVTVLGNHDLYLITLYYKIFKKSDFDHSLDELLENNNIDSYINWLKTKPLLYFDADYNYALVHAGIDPAWDINQALNLANEVEIILKNEDINIIKQFLHNMYGNSPNKWQESLSNYDRLRYITNVFTRMRFIYQDGSLDFDNKETIAKADSKLIPWFDYPNRLTKNTKIIFGHWAALEGIFQENIFGIDSGCVWGKKLTAMCLDTNKLFHVSCKKS